MSFRSRVQLIVAVCLAALFQARAAAIGEIPFQYRDGFIWLKVDAAGQATPLNFLLDSGASSSVLDIRAARRLCGKLGIRQSVYGVHSHTIAYRIDGFKAEAAGISLPESLLAVDLSGVSGTFHQPVHGLIGADFLRGRIVQIDFAARKVRILDRAEPNRLSAVLPIKWYNGAICVSASVSGNSAQWMRLDTGCETALEWAPRKARAQSNRGMRDASIGLSSASVRYSQATIQLGSHTLSEVEIGVHDQEIFSGEGGLLGNGVLSRFRVTIDARGGRVIFDET